MKKSKGQRMTLQIRPGVVPTAERWQHNGGLISEAILAEDGRTHVSRYKAVWECPLDAFRDFKIIGVREYQAGLRFKEVYYQAVMSPYAAYVRLNDHLTFTGLTMSQKLLKEAHEELSLEEMRAVVSACGYGHLLWSPATREKLRRGLGHLAIAWHSNAIEVCEHKRS